MTRRFFRHQGDRTPPMVSSPGELPPSRPVPLPSSGVSSHSKLDRITGFFRRQLDKEIQQRASHWFHRQADRLFHRVQDAANNTMGAGVTGSGGGGVDVNAMMQMFGEREENGGGDHEMTSRPSSANNSLVSSSAGSSSSRGTRTLMDEEPVSSSSFNGKRQRRRNHHHHPTPRTTAISSSSSSLSGVKARPASHTLTGSMSHRRHRPVPTNVSFDQLHSEYGWSPFWQTPPLSPSPSTLLRRTQSDVRMEGGDDHDHVHRPITDLKSGGNEYANDVTVRMMTWPLNATPL